MYTTFTCSTVSQEVKLLVQGQKPKKNLIQRFLRSYPLFLFSFELIRKHIHLFFFLHIPSPILPSFHPSIHSLNPLLDFNCIKWTLMVMWKSPRDVGQGIINLLRKTSPTGHLPPLLHTCPLQIHLMVSYRVPT